MTDFQFGAIALVVMFAGFLLDSTLLKILRALERIADTQEEAHK